MRSELPSNIGVLSKPENDMTLVKAGAGKREGNSSSVSFDEEVVENLPLLVQELLDELDFGPPSSPTSLLQSTRSSSASSASSDFPGCEYSSRASNTFERDIEGMGTRREERGGADDFRLPISLWRVRNGCPDKVADDRGGDFGDKCPIAGSDSAMLWR